MENEIIDETKTKLRPQQRLAIQEYFVDFLGGLVPGVLFLVAAVFGILQPLHALSMALQPERNRQPLINVLETFFTSIKDTPSAIWLILFAGTTLLAYIVGHLFYRSDPKIPDKKSFRRLKKDKVNQYLRGKENTEISALKKLKAKVSGAEKVDLDDEQKKELDKILKEDLGCTDESECEFPYPYYQQYLSNRGLTHLEDFVLWQEEEKAHFRSKTYINLLKIRLRYYFPEKCGTIIRNEAHVRLASSTWYVSRILFIFGLIGLFITAIALYIVFCANSLSIREAISWHINPVLSPLMVIIFSSYLKWSIQKFLHYQRLREVFFVLETAHTAFSERPDLLDPPFKIKKRWGNLEETPKKKNTKR